jgi:hypothetical protein
MAPLIKGAPTRARREQANEIIAQDLADATTLLRKLEGAEAAAIAKAEKASGSKPLSDWREAVGRQARDIWDVSVRSPTGSGILLTDVWLPVYSRIEGRYQCPARPHDSCPGSDLAALGRARPDRRAVWLVDHGHVWRRQRS